MRQRIRIRERLPIWGLRLVLGAILLTLSEIVMWQNPPARAARPLDWPLLLILYTALAGILMDLVVRFQARNPATLLLVSGLYGLAAATIISRNALDNLPFSLVVRGLGLQTGAGLYGLLLFVSVMRGKQVAPLQIGGAVAVGILWGIWLHWYPIQEKVQWGLVPIETATIYILPVLVLVGFLIVVVAPRFQFLREKQMELLWWEAIVAGVPLFLVLIYGMLEETIPFIPLLLVFVIGGFMVWALFYQRGGYEPSILAQMIFAAPNAITYIVLGIVFLVAGLVAYSFVTDANSVVGIATYWLVFIFGSGWLPATSLIIFWRAFRVQTAPVTDDDDDKPVQAG